MPEHPLPIKATQILIPKKACQNQHWPVVACDQYTSEPEYWKKRAHDNVNQPSTLNLILPEYLLEEKGENNCQDELDSIWQNMDKYLEDGIFETLDPGFILCSRLLPDGKTRRNGVVLAIDLDAYLSSDLGEPAIRASEATVESRLPIRIAVREHASLELPHILLLIDDSKAEAIEGLARTLLHAQNPLYAIPLPDKAGQVTGYFVPENSQAAQTFTESLRNLPSFKEQGLFSYVGDGNHSLAAAKRIREKELRNGKTNKNSPARYALVELINIHDAGLIFHPIHQLIYETSPEEALSFAKEIFKDEAIESSEALPFETACKEFTESEASGTHSLLLRQGNTAYLLRLKKPQDVLAISAAHRLSGGMRAKLGKRIDYIHGEASLAELSKHKNLAIYLPELQKTDFFPALEKLKVLPKKTFSLGEAAEKRHYIEARCIK